MADYRSKGKLHSKRTGKTKVTKSSTRAYPGGGTKRKKKKIQQSNPRVLPGMSVQGGVEQPAPGTTGIMAIPPAGGSYTKFHETGETIVEREPSPAKEIKL